MGFEIIIKPAAWLDLVDAMVWYDEKRTNFGREFFNDFERSINRIIENPKAFKEITKEIRRIPTKRFPYKIFYTFSENTIFILGIFHAKRSNSFIRRKLKR